MLKSIVLVPQSLHNDATPLDPKVGEVVVLNGDQVVDFLLQIWMNLLTNMRINWEIELEYSWYLDMQYCIFICTINY